MTPLGTLHTYLPNARILKILAAAKLNGVQLDVPTDFDVHTTNQSPEFLARWPMGKVPAFESRDGLCLAESSAIAHYVARSGPRANQLLGTNAAESASIQQWIHFSDAEVFPNVIDLVSPLVGKAPYDAQVDDKATKQLDRALDCVERHLEKSAGGEWIAGTSQLSLADLECASAFYWAFMWIVDSGRRKRCPITTEWFLRLLQDDSVKDVFGPPRLIDTRCRVGDAPTWV